MKKIRIAYFGSPDFAADFLEKLITDVLINQLIDIKLIVTQPDMQVGRKQILTPTPVKITALKHNLRFLEIGNFLGQLDQLEISNFDLALVYAFGELIPKELLGLPKYGFWNIHPSLLPKYRGPSPIATPLINGDETTGVTIIKMDEEIDHGLIIAQQSLTIKKTDQRPDLEKKLTDLAFEMFKKLIGEDTKFFAVFGFPSKNFGIEPLTPQNDKLATYTKKLTKQDGFIEISKLKNQISKNSEELFNLFRGLIPWPGIWTLVDINGQQKRLKIIGLNIVRNKNLCSLQIKRVQLEGKNEVDFETFNKAYKLF